MEQNRNSQNLHPDQQSPTWPNDGYDRAISEIEQQLAQNFRELLLNTLRDRKSMVDIYELDRDHYILDCEYSIKMEDDDAIVPTYFIKGLGYTDGKIKKEAVSDRGPYRKVAPLHQKITIENPTIVAVLEWNMGELYSKSYRTFMQNIKGGRQNPLFSKARFAHNLHLSIFCRDKGPFPITPAT